MSNIAHRIKTFTPVRHSKLYLESSRQLDAAAFLTLLHKPLGMDAAASIFCLTPDQARGDSGGVCNSKTLGLSI
jgi:hypothetical protein